ncbi:hypothetical protein HYU07_06460 [Candidatus Woesearchaeota archaeon]|nr:hypothetical protein [Candidatus Woesearchaeota archaeon]
METLIEPKKYTRSYGMQKLWLCNVYGLDKQSKNVDVKETLKRIVGVCEKDKPKIERLVGGNFEINNGVEDRGTHISYPKLRFNIGDEHYVCNVNINPSITQTAHWYKDKIWVNIESMLQQPIGNLREFFNKIKNYAEKIEETVKSSYFSAIGGYEFKHAYEITIRDAGIEMEKGSKLDELMKAEPDQSLGDILNDGHVQAVLRDLLSAHKNRIVHSTIDELRGSDIRWRTTQDSEGHTLLSGIEITKDSLNVIGLANFLDEEELNNKRVFHILMMVNNI